MEREFKRQLGILAIERRPEACLGCGFEHGCSLHGCAVIGSACERLAAYEDTGLEPEEIVQLKCSVEEIRKEVDTIYDNQIFVKMLRDKGVVDIDSGIQHMQELIAAEEQARLVVLPCKIGDTVYSHARKFDGADYVRGTEFWWSDIPEMGKTVFLTREAAEAALEERECSK